MFIIKKTQKCWTVSTNQICSSLPPTQIMTLLGDLLQKFPTCEFSNFPKLGQNVFQLQKVPIFVPPSKLFFSMKTRYFDQGFRLLSAFDFRRAVLSFRAAGRASSKSCVLCLWGEALALGPNLNSFDEPRWAVLPRMDGLDSDLNMLKFQYFRTAI